MKTANSFAATFLLCLTGSAFAEGPIAYPEDVPMLSSKTRAEVQAELREAQRLGLASYATVAHSPIAPTTRSPRSRAEVEAELREARRLGLVAYGEVEPVAGAAQAAQHADAAELQSSGQ